MICTGPTRMRFAMIPKKPGSCFHILTVPAEGPCPCRIEYSWMYKDYTSPAHPNIQDDLHNKPEEQRMWAEPRLKRVPPPIHSPQFFGSHTFIDNEIGRVLDVMESLAPGALVLYTSEHGVFLESHRLTDKGPAVHDEITRVPFIAMWTGHTPANASSSSLVSHIDLNGTLMEFFGFEIPSLLQRAAWARRGIFGGYHRGFEGEAEMACGHHRRSASWSIGPW